MPSSLWKIGINVKMDIHICILYQVKNDTTVNNEFKLNIKRKSTFTEIISPMNDNRRLLVPGYI